MGMRRKDAYGDMSEWRMDSSSDEGGADDGHPLLGSKGPACQRRVRMAPLMAVRGVADDDAPLVWMAEEDEVLVCTHPRVQCTQSEVCAHFRLLR